MRSGLSKLLGLIAFAWLVWAVTLSGLTVFLYLSTGTGAWDGHLSYSVSALGLIPVIGGVIASFMADTVHGWGFFHAAFNLIGYLLPAALAGMLEKRSTS